MGTRRISVGPKPPPFIYKQFTVQIIQQPDKVTFLYNGNMDVRRVRLNERHAEPLRPSLYGDSVGHYEGDTLVIDTVGVRTDRPYAMIDLFGTPYTSLCTSSNAIGCAITMT